MIDHSKKWEVDHTDYSIQLPQSISIFIIAQNKQDTVSENTQQKAKLPKGAWFCNP